MGEVMEPEIKLFGRKIVLPENGKEFSVVSSDESIGRGTRSVPCGIEDGQVQADIDEEKVSAICESGLDEEEDVDAAEKEEEDHNAMSETDDNPKTPSIEEENMSTTHAQSDNDQSNAANGQQKVLKKPDKILPCPRCNSMDTKFCYYNNYNISQPRHFCKSCQRYWTAGGTMRNIPVGAGRRKNKNSSSNCRHIMISEALQASIIDGYNGYCPTTLKPNDTVLSFSPDSLLCKSVASVMKLEEKCVSNGNVDQGGASCKSKDNSNDLSDGSSVNTLNSEVTGGKIGTPQPMIAINHFQPPVPCIPGVSWQLPWNPAVQLPAIFPPCGFPLPFYPAPYWNCGAPNSWNAPWLQVPSPPIASQEVASSGPSSPLGKHSRNGKLLNASNSEGEKNSESSIVVPKTLRIDDPEEAAKSSIWETLGINYDSLNRDGLFKALQPRCNQKKPTKSTSPGLLQANPAALSRSITFQESA